MHLQCRKYGVVYSLFEVIHHWIPFLVDAFLTPSVKDHARPDKNVNIVNIIFSPCILPDTPEALVCGGGDNVGIIKGGGDHTSSNKARYVGHVCSRIVILGICRNYHLLQNHLQVAVR